MVAKKRKKAQKKPTSLAIKEPEVEKSINEVIEERMEDFAEEIAEIGDRIGKKIEEKGEYWEKKGKAWGRRARRAKVWGYRTQQRDIEQEDEQWHHRQYMQKPFGILGPLISSIVGIIILGFIIWGISFVNIGLRNEFLSNLQIFLLSNFGLLFVISIFFSYTSYFSKEHPTGYVPFSPIVSAAGIIIVLWLLIQMLGIVNSSFWIQGISEMFGITKIYIEYYLFSIFWVILAFGYIILAIKISTGTLELRYRSYGSDFMAKRKIKRSAAKPSTRPSAEIRRLYRSGSDKILGGVCGGIGEYLNVDPVIIRLLWILISFAWGAGVLLYIIAWIIIPRNPKHRW